MSATLTAVRSSTTGSASQNSAAQDSASQDGAPTDRRAELAAAAYRLIAARGLDGFSMRLLAREVGATTGLVTHHFLDRAEIISAALDHATSVMNRRAAGAAGHPIDAIAAVLPTDAETVENWRFALTVRAAAMVDPELRRFDAEIHEQWHRYLPDALAEHGVLSPGTSPEEAVDHLVAVIDGIALRAALEPKRWPPERQLTHLQRAFTSI